MDNINSLIRNTATNSSDIDPTASINPNTNLKDTDVIQIWDEVSSYIEKLMSQSKGVSLPGFGTFSFVQKKLDIGNNKFVLLQRPVFAISEKFAQNHGLSYNKYPVTGSIPVHPLNYSAISNETAFSRDNIESCVRHVLQVFNRSVQSRKNIEFTFTGIGKLQIRNSKVKMKFFKDFVNSHDSTGKSVAQMQNRPNTADSVMSRNETHRPGSKNTCILPRINSRAGAMSPTPNENHATMDTIREENGEETNEIMRRIDEQLEQQASPKVLAPVATLYSTYEDQKAAENDQAVAAALASASAETSGAKYQIPEAFSVRSSNVVFESKSNANFTAAAAAEQPATQLNRSLATLSAGVRKNAELLRPSSKSLIGSLMNNRQQQQTPPHSACGHHNAGQELCYLCHQRTRRNVPVYLHEEVKRKDEEETALLSQYQQMKDTEKQLSDEEKRNIQRMERAKQDAFNLGIAEALKAKKQERPKTSDIPRSFIFRKRVRTPPKIFKQNDLKEYLTYQIEDKRKEQSLMKQEMSHFEKLEQKQLAEDLAAQREAYLKEKYSKQNELKSALDYQVKTKGPPLPRAEPDSEVFGEYDAKNEKLVEQKRREIEAFKYHKDLIEQRRREDLLRQVREQEIDAENVEKCKEEYRIDRANRYKRMLDMRKTLERDWFEMHQEKKQRDYEEKEFRKAHAGELVHEQCDRYKRCAQCKRDLKNCGESNVWADTRYPPGTRLMT